ncbi:hypothetical protein MBANPS3_006838 [Mucor bainieri]
MSTSANRTSATPTRATPAPSSANSKANWSPAEQSQLCRAWINASLNPIIGTSQTSSQFYDLVKRKFDERMHYDGHERSKDAVRKHWLRAISRKMMNISEPIRQYYYQKLRDDISKSIDIELSQQSLGEGANEPLHKRRATVSNQEEEEKEEKEEDIYS